MDKMLFKIVSVSEYHGLSRTGKPYTLNTLEIDYNGEKAKIKTFEGDAKPGDYAEICIGLKKSVYGSEIVAMVNKIVSAAEMPDKQ
ncbi:MAG: hypothetical protein ACLU8C_07605 [Lacrimispora saccharolytica]